jgi:hypothetical protein
VSERASERANIQKCVTQLEVRERLECRHRRRRRLATSCYVGLRFRAAAAFSDAAAACCGYERWEPTTGRTTLARWLAAYILYIHPIGHVGRTCSWRKGFSQSLIDPARGQ